jgi:TRAP-type C4-dicarboxylate transport system substrate-binding protein
MKFMSLKNIAYKTAALSLVAGCLAFNSVAHAETTWRFATKQPAESPEGKGFQFFADKVKEYSGGDLVVQVYPSEQLGKEAAILEQLELGTVQLYAEDAFFLQKWVPDIKWVAPIFLFQDRDQWKKFVQSDLVQGWLKQVEETAGVRTLGDPTAFVRGPYRVLISKEPIDTYEKMKTIQLRMYPDQLAIAVWSHLGADLRMLAWTETYEGLKSGIASAVTSPAALIESMRFYEVAPYITRTNEFWQGLMFSMNGEAFDDLPEKDQQALLKAHADAGEFSAKLMKETTDTMESKLVAQGVKFVDMDLTPLFADMAKWYADEEKAGRLPAGFMDAANAAKN